MLSNDRRSYKFMAARYEMSLSERLRNSVYLYALQDLSGVSLTFRRILARHWVHEAARRM